MSPLWHPSRVSPDRGRQLWLVPVLLVTVIATAIGGLLARQWYEDPGPGAPDAVLPTDLTVPPEKQPGSGVVRGTADATVHPLYEPLREVLQTHFDSINRRDYESWAGTVTDSRVEEQPEETWRSNYRSTQDGRIVIYRIQLAEDDETARVLMTFTSIQDEADAPPELQAGCIHWNVVFPMVLSPTGWKIDAGPAASSPQHEPCT